MDSLSKEWIGEILHKLYIHLYMLPIYNLCSKVLTYWEALCLNLATSYNSISIKVTLYYPEKGRASSCGVSSNPYPSTTHQETTVLMKQRTTWARNGHGESTKSMMFWHILNDKSSDWTLPLKTSTQRMQIKCTWVSRTTLLSWAWIYSHVSLSECELNSH